MGCCFSTNKADNQTPSSPKDQDLQNRALVPESDTPHEPTQTNIKPPIPKPHVPATAPVLEEEFVKEVLSETPTPKPSFLKTDQQQLQKQRILRLPTFPRIEQEKKKGAEVSEISEVSEICSLSETSVSTSALTETSHDFEVHQRFERSPITRKRSVSSEFTFQAGNSPARRREQHSVGGGGSNAMRSVSSGGNVQRQVVARNGSPRRDPGESSGRRSRSPATRNDVNGGVTSSRTEMFRSPSRRIVESSPGRMPVVSPEKRRMVEEEKWQIKESIEDPLVSLECFIFL